MEFGARSDPGRVRGNNEDSFRLAPEMGLFVLSDGMGGLEAGEVASRLAVETVVEHCQQAEADPALAVFGKQIEGVSEASNRIASAVRLANSEIYENARNRGGNAAMGAPSMPGQKTPRKLASPMHPEAIDSGAEKLNCHTYRKLSQFPAPFGP